MSQIISNCQKFEARRVIGVRMMSDFLCSSLLFFLFSYSGLNESVFHTTNDESNPKKIGERSKEFATYLKQANVSS